MQSSARFIKKAAIFYNIQKHSFKGLGVNTDFSKGLPALAIDDTVPYDRADFVVVSEFVQKVSQLGICISYWCPFLLFLEF